MPAACTRWRTPNPFFNSPQTAAAQFRALCGRLPAGQAVRCSSSTAAMTSAQLTLDLAEERVAVLVRLRSDRCFCLRRPATSGAFPKGGRPRRHGAKFAFADPATWPTPTARLVCQDDQYGTVTVQAWDGLASKAAAPPRPRHP